MFKKFFFLLLLGSFACLAKGQGSFAIHVDKPFYVTGEVIWYKIYLPASLDQEVALKGLLITPRATVSNRFFHKAIAGQQVIEGFLKLPFNFSSGIYRLEFRANVDPFTPEIQLVNIDLPVYNDFEIQSLAEKLADQAEEEPPANTTDLSTGDLQINVNLDRESYQTRGTVSATVSVQDQAGNPVEATFSVASTDADLVYRAFPGAPAFAMGPELPQSQLDQIRGKVYVKAMLTDTLNQPIRANVLGAYASLHKRIHYGKTNAEGFFTFELPDFYGEQTLQFIGYLKEHEEIRVKMIPEVKPGQQPKGELPLNRAILEYLKVSQQKKNMSEYFENLKPTVDMPRVDNEFEGLKADFTYVTEDYVKFENIGGFFDELLTPLKFRRVKGIYTARMENPAARDASFSMLPGKPLFIIDGKVTRNADFIARTSWANVKTIDIFYIAEKLRRQFNVMGSGGVVRIETDIPQFDLPPNDLEDVFTVSGLQYPGSFVPNQISSSSEVRTPYFTLPAFWSNPITTDANGRATFAYQHGDDKSNFVITIFARTPDGRMGYAAQTYEVK